MCPSPLQLSVFYVSASPHSFASASFAMAPAKEQMVKHVHHVLQPSSDLGVLDFLASAVAKKLNCFLYIGRGQTDWRAVFGQGLDKLPASAGDCHVVGTYNDGGVSLYSGTVSNGIPSVNHGFLPHGLAPVATRTVDCGLDVLAHALGMHRSPEVYLSLRIDLARFLLERLYDPVWENWKTVGWAGCVVVPRSGSGTSGGNGGVVAAAVVSTMAGPPWLQTLVAGSGSGGSSGGVDHGGGALHVGGSGAGCSGAGGSGAGGSGAGGQPAAKAKAAIKGKPAAQASGKGKTASAKASGKSKTASAKASQGSGRTGDSKRVRQ